MKGACAHEIQKLESRQKIQQLSDSEWSTLYAYRTKIKQIFERENKKWRQGAIHQWAREGDVNTVIFHRSTTKKHRYNRINALNSTNGVVTGSVELKRRVGTLQTFLGK